MSETQLSPGRGCYDGMQVMTMPTFVLVGLPALIIAVLGGIVAYERHAKSSEAHKRADKLKRWLDSQGSTQ